MRIAVIGAGIVGLTIAREILQKNPNTELEVYDAYSIPSKGTSKRNSGVMHAGLYYEPKSLKAKLCIEGRKLLSKYITDNRLDILRCGKLLVPNDKKDIKNLLSIQENADKNECQTKLVDYKFANSIQPFIITKEMYLWSPNTNVFSPDQILRKIKEELDEKKCKFIVDAVERLDCNSGLLYAKKNGKRVYDYIFNAAGPGALKLFQTVSNKEENLRILPFLGEYGVMLAGPEIKTNLYPVPDPQLPFLGVHITPRCQGLQPLLGPNAIPYFRLYIDEFKHDDITDIIPRLGHVASMFIQNKGNFREHARREITLNKTRKFQKSACSYFSDQQVNPIKINMDANTYGIRPQLVDKNTNELINDFKLELLGKSAHIINAVSPAFTSSLALAKYVVNESIESGEFDIYK